MRILIVEDDFVSRRILLRILGCHGETDVAVDGREACAAFELALDEGRPYDLAVLDIMMPNMDGREALARMREIESARGIDGLARAKIIMATALSDSKNILGSFFEGGCDGYVVKPYDREKIEAQMEKLGLI